MCAGSISFQVFFLKCVIRLLTPAQVNRFSCLPVAKMKWTAKTQFKTDEHGRNWRRRVGETKWQSMDDVELPPQPPSSNSPPSIDDANRGPLRFLIVREDQAEGEPKHWYLGLCSDDDVCVRVFQVTGDATYMVFKTEENIDRLHSSDYHSSYELKADLVPRDVSIVEEVVQAEPPPQAPDRRSVKENCQGWTLRVLDRLAGGGLVKAKDVDWIRRDWLEPV